MIYLDITLEQFLIRHEEFNVESGSCNYCHSILRTTIPFIEKNYLGLVSPLCPCGKGTNETMTMVPTSKEEIEYWNDFLVSE